MAMGVLEPNYLASGCSEWWRGSGGSPLLGAKSPGVEGTGSLRLPSSSYPGNYLPDLDGRRGGGAAPSVLRTEDSPAGRPAPHLPARARPPAPPAGSPPLTAALAALALAHRSAPPSARPQTAKLSKSCGKGTSEQSWARGGAGTPRPRGTKAAVGPSPAPHPCSRSLPPVGDRGSFPQRPGRPRVSPYPLQSFSIPASEPRGRRHLVPGGGWGCGSLVPRGPVARTVLCGEFAALRTWGSRSRGAWSRILCGFARGAAGRRGRGSLAPSRSALSVSSPWTPPLASCPSPAYLHHLQFASFAPVQASGICSTAVVGRGGRSRVRDWGCRLELWRWGSRGAVWYATGVEMCVCG